MTVTINHTTPADGTFSTEGAAAWDAAHAVTGLGTLAEQNADAVAITGGAIDGTPIGATTPSTGSFTTLTAQTEVLKGTGQNLFFYSEQFQQSAYWPLVAATITADTTTAPNGTTTADSLIEDGTLNNHDVYQQISAIASATYTFSCYVKASTRSIAYLRLGGTINKNAFFNLNTGVVGTVDTGLTASISSAGSGWYRLSISYVPTSSGAINWAIGSAITDGATSYTGTNGTSAIYVWGGQLELASTVGTYIPTTTTAVYGTPSLSFSGVAGIGLESNGSLYHQPAGSGAVQAQATTSSTVGGNARGTYAVDWQMSRSGSSQVASATNSVICGGGQNTASNSYGVVAGGVANANTAAYGFIGSGYSNNVNGNLSFVGTGNANTAGGFLNFIGGGYGNSATANAAVTTQATTTVTSGSTAVTLSGSNANIKVGQLVTGTGMPIYPHTYVAAISGTSLTLSQAANASGSPTLSFYTPHGVVVGGGNNQATGSYSFIGGGGDAGTSANRNVASGDWSVVCGGGKNVASGIGAFVGVNSSPTTAANTASGVGAVIVGGTNQNSTATNTFIGCGFSNTASAYTSGIVAGNSNTTNSRSSGILSGEWGTSRSIVGYQVMPACSVPIGSTSGITQTALLVLARQTTDATATVLASDSNVAGTTNQVILPNNSAYYFKGSVIANVTGAANGAAWEISGAIMRGANAASTVLIGTPTVNRIAATAGASAWVVTATADTTNGGLKITVTGAAATTIRWVAQIQTTEVTF